MDYDNLPPGCRWTFDCWCPGVCYTCEDWDGPPRECVDEDEEYDEWEDDE